MESSGCGKKLNISVLFCFLVQPGPALYILVTSRENVTTARVPECQTPAIPTNVVSIEAKNRQILCNCWQIMEIDAELVIVR